jgi:choline-sulfatase
MNRKPNILIIMPDQQRADCLSCAGHLQLKTSNMDRIASSGVRFEQATTVSPVCMSARASFVNSLYPHNHGMWSNRGCMPASDDTFFHHLQSAGYYTAYVGKSHYYGHGRGHMRDYEGYMHARGLEYIHEVTGPLATQSTRSYMTDELERHGLYEAFKEDYAGRVGIRKENPFLVRPSPLPVELFLDSYVGRQGVGFIENYSNPRPMCLFVGFPGPHEPWDAPGEYASMYDPEKTPDPIPYQELNESIPEEIRQMEDFQPMGSSSPDNIRAVRANYYGKISLIDRWVGKILDACEEGKLGEDLLIVYWSDHGDLLGDHRRVYKGTFHEGSMRVPLMLSWPGQLPEGQTSDALAEIIDVYPTLMDALGLDTPTRCQGRSLIPIMKDPDAEFRESQLSEISFAYERRICLRTRDYKYSVRQNGDGYMLFDLDNDPVEQRNLVCQDEDIEREMRDMLLRRIIGTQYSMERNVPELVD